MQVVLGLGSNLGDRLATIKQAIILLEKGIGRRTHGSTFYETEPWGFQAETKFLNAVAVFQSELAPQNVLHICQEIETALGRTRLSHQRYASRTIDIDILFYGQHILETDTLSIPHPLICFREFVLLPLQEILPDFVHPILGIPLRDIVLQRQG